MSSVESENDMTEGSVMENEADTSVIGLAVIFKRGNPEELMDQPQLKKVKLSADDEAEGVLSGAATSASETSSLQDNLTVEIDDVENAVEEQGEGEDYAEANVLNVNATIDVGSPMRAPATPARTSIPASPSTPRTPFSPGNAATGRGSPPPIRKDFSAARGGDFPVAGVRLDFNMGLEIEFPSTASPRRSE